MLRTVSGVFSFPLSVRGLTPLGLSTWRGRVVNWDGVGKAVGGAGGGAEQKCIVETVSVCLPLRMLHVEMLPSELDVGARHPKKSWAGALYCGAGRRSFKQESGRDHKEVSIDRSPRVEQGQGEEEETAAVAKKWVGGHGGGRRVREYSVPEGAEKGCPEGGSISREGR